MKISFIVFTLFTFVSCIAFKAIRPIPVLPKEAVILAPPLNEVFKVELGESLIQAEIGNKFQGIIVLQDVLIHKSMPSSFTNKYTKTEQKVIDKNESFKLTSQTETYNLYTNKSSRYGIAITKNENATFLFESNLMNQGTISIVSGNLLIKHSKTSIPDSDFLRQEFIYNGKLGNGLKFTYREFTDNLARAAFTQDLQYDLSESDTIGFKGMRIKVINAQNTKIEYKVLTYFK